MDQDITIAEAVAATIKRRMQMRQAVQQAERELAEAGVRFKDTAHGTAWAFSKVPVPEESAAVKQG